MSDDQTVSEEIDPDELGDDPGGNLEYPAEGYLGALDPTSDDRVTDSIESRELRDDIGDEPDDAVRLSAPGDVWADDESELIGDAEDIDDPSAEEAAIHVVDDPSD